MSIDSRLLDSACQANIDENFDRTLAIVDAGGGLPEIAAGDAGKVLTVNEDADGVEWASGGGGGASVLVVNITENEGIYSCDKTASEMLTAYESGVVLIRSQTGDTARKYRTVIEAGDFGEDGFAFSVYNAWDGAVETYSCANGTDYPVLE